MTQTPPPFPANLSFSDPISLFPETSGGFCFCWLQKAKEPVTLPAKWVYSGRTEEFQFRTSKPWQTTGKPREQRKGACFHRGKEETGRRDCFIEFSLAGLLLGKKKFFLPRARVGKASCFLLGIETYFLQQVVMHESSPFGASWLHFKWGFLYFHISPFQSRSFF